MHRRAMNDTKRTIQVRESLGQMKNPSPGQIKAGRHLAGLSQADVVDATGLSIRTIKRAEDEQGATISDAAIAAIVDTLEAAGVIFIAEGEMRDGGPGVRLRQNPKQL
ncbi:helix-turn-helix domain-containing protein [Methylocella sp.]|uniref:helix-turn-helix domain-containing protein n=1 Tax=Methylocella sp. TaxID=1978226 RepID=UPI0037841FC4